MTRIAWRITCLLATLLLSYGSTHVLNEDCEPSEDSDDLDLVQTQTWIMKAAKTSVAHSGDAKSIVSAAAQATINLNDPPRERWKAIAQRYKQDWIDTVVATMGRVESNLGADDIEAWFQNHNIYPEYVEELKGIVEVMDDPRVDLKRMIIFSLVYELGKPPSLHQGCTGILAQQSDGSVVQGRNLDYMLPTDASKYSTEVTFYRDGKPLFVSVFMLSSGVHTGMRFEGYSFQQNTRLALLDGKKNLLNAINGGLPFQFAVRKIMEEVPDYRTAVQKLEGLSFIAAQYFIMAGTKKEEGMVFAVDGMRPHIPPYTSTYALNSAIGRHFLLQTNDDLWDKPHDIRRETGIVELNLVNETYVTEDVVEKVLTKYPLQIPIASVLTWIANPAKGTHRLLVHSEITALQPAAFKSGKTLKELIKEYRQKHPLPSTPSTSSSNM